MVTKTIVNRIQVTKCLIRILKIYFRTISNEGLWEIFKFYMLDVMMRQRKRNWIGHTIATIEDIANRSPSWNLQGSRKNGRAKSTWKRLVIDKARAARR